MNKFMQYFAKIKNFLLDAYSKNKRRFILFSGLCVVFFVCFICVFLVPKNGVKKSNISGEIVSIDSYADGLENKIESALLNMKSVSKVEVFVMVESSPVKNFLMETEVVKVGGENGSTTTSSKVVYNKNGSSTSPVEISTTMPKVTGVLIFINKIDASTKLSIINAVSVVLNVDSSCISILQDN